MIADDSCEHMPSDFPRHILKALAIGVISLDRELKITYLNHAGSQLAGIKPEDALGRSCCDVFKSSLCDGECPMAQVFQTRENLYNRDAVFIRQDGRSVVPVKLSASPLFDQSGEMTGGVMTLQGYGLSKMLDRDKGYEWQDFLGQSPQVKRMFEVLKVVAPSNATILIEGPTGTGKGLLSNIIHQNSPRAKKPLIKVNCAALPENLLESEMFGYVRGAFTGADRNKPGRFQLADHGTIFLDEVSEMPLPLQAKLLKVIEEQEFYPLGARTTTKVDVRILPRLQQAPGPAGEGRPVPRGPVLPAQRDPGLHSPLERAHPGYPRTYPQLHPKEERGAGHLYLQAFRRGLEPDAEP